MAKEHPPQPKKRRIKNHHIAPHHKEPVAAVVIGLLLLALCCLFAVGVVMTKAYLRVRGHKDDVISTSAPAVVAPEKLQASIIGVSYSEGEPGFEPNEGQHYIILQVEVTHHLASPTWLTPLLQSYILDQKGAKYTMSPISMDNPFDARQYAGGEHATGGLSYMVPKNADHFQWCYVIPEQSLKTCSMVN